MPKTDRGWPTTSTGHCPVDRPYQTKQIRERPSTERRMQCLIRSVAAVCLITVVLNFCVELADESVVVGIDHSSKQQQFQFLDLRRHIDEFILDAFHPRGT
jgi:hypothetical protein